MLHGKKLVTDNGYAMIACFLAALFFLAVYGTEVLNPLYDEWLLRGGDLTQHYIGWEFFRASDWQFPVGLMDRIAWPNDVSVIFTDSIPLFAVLFKGLSPALPATFQYFGWWELLCFLLQGFLAAKLLFCFTEDKRVSVTGSLFFVLAPVFLAKVFVHTALSSQWILLLALYISVKDLCGGRQKLRRSLAVWAGMGALCGSVHLYYIPMCGIILLGFVLANVLTERKLLRYLPVPAVYIFSAALTVALLGGLSHDHQLDAGGLGQFSFNLNGFFNSMGWSRLLPALSAYGEGAVEGLAYLGLGMFLLLAVLTVCFLLSRPVLKKAFPRICGDRREVYAYGFIIPVSVLISVSHRIAVNRELVFEAPYPAKLVSLWGMFRSSGRFIWPVVFILMLLTVRGIAKAVPGRYALPALLSVAVLLQVYDISGVLHEKSREFESGTAYDTPLKSDVWDRLTENKEHFVFVSQVTQNQDLLYGVSQYALERNMTVNDFYLAHSASAGDIQESLEESMGNISADTVYLFKPEEAERCGEYDLQYYRIDGFIVGLKAAYAYLEPYRMEEYGANEKK